METKITRLGFSEGIGLIFALTVSRLFLTTPTNILFYSDSAAWISVLISGIVAFAGMLLLCYVSRYIPKDIIGVSSTLLGKYGGWIIGLFYVVLFFTDYVLLIRQFAENTLLTALPKGEFSIVIGMYTIPAILFSYLGTESLGRAAYVILPFFIIGLLLVLVLLYPFLDFYYLLPWQGTGIEQVVISGIFSSGINFGAILAFVIFPSLQNMRTVKTSIMFGLGGSVILKSLSILVFTTAFGYAVGIEKTLPFFEMSRLVYVSRYIQRLESIFILLWVIIGVLSIAISLHFGLIILGRLFKLPSIIPIAPLVGLALAQVAMMPRDITRVIALDYKMISTLFLTGTIFIPLLLLCIMFLRRKGLSVCDLE